MLFLSLAGAMEIVGAFNEYEDSSLYFPPNVLVEAFLADEDPSGLLPFVQAGLTQVP